MNPSNAQGSLWVVGTGIRAGAQLTPEATQRIEAADVVFYLVTDDISGSVLSGHNPNLISLATHYSSTKHRRDTYAEMVEAILTEVKQGKDVCVAFYGHPGIYADPAHEAIRTARAQGYPATMLPGISALDCLFADLGIDPGEGGCAAYMAHDFLVTPRTFDVHASLILLQVAAIGVPTEPKEPNTAGIAVLADVLARHYGAHHSVTLYVAAMFPVGDPIITDVEISALATAEVHPLATLYVPPLSPAPEDADMVARLEKTTPASASAPS